MSTKKTQALSGLEPEPAYVQLCGLAGLGGKLRQERDGAGRHVELLLGGRMRLARRRDGGDGGGECGKCGEIGAGRGRRAKA